VRARQGANMSAPNPACKPVAHAEPEVRLPRGIRNHNPGNIVRNKSITWQGQAEDQSGDGEFVVFTAPVWGLRAAARVLLSYQRRGVVTPHAIAHTWAPPKHKRPDGVVVDNHTSHYASALADAAGVARNDPLDARDPDVMRKLLAAIVQQENGMQPYPPELFDQAMDLAGLDVPGFPAAD